MKKVALLMESWKRYFTSAWPVGFKRRVDETGEDISLYIFNCSDGLSRSEIEQNGEYNIFRLPDFNDFDGAILDINNIKSCTILEELIETLKKAKIPLFSVAYDLEGFNYVGIDNYAAMRSIIEHVHKVHGAKKFFFIMGPEDNFENLERARALRDYMLENNIEFAEDDFYFENYEFDTGCHGFTLFMKLGHEKVDAIICANDNIALGVCETAKKYGYNVPEDFIVTGFDDFDKASFYKPRITTVGHIREEVGYTCADLFIKIWNGEKVPDRNFTPTIPIFQDSCGCTHQATDLEARIKNDILYGIQNDSFDELINTLDYSLSNCSNASDMMDVLVKYIPAVECQAFAVVFDDAMNKGFENSSDMDGGPIWADEMFGNNGYPQKMKVMLYYENGVRYPENETYINGLFPCFDTKESSVSLYMPIHFQDKAVGYLAVKDPLKTMLNQYLFRLVGSLTYALDNLHRKRTLEHINNTLTELYVRDAMTELYNRLGMLKIAPDFVAKIHEEKGAVLVVFIDMDRLKFINDNYGHQQGDAALIAVADSIKNFADADSVPIRNGGDEFVLIQKFKDDKTTLALINKIKKDLIKYSIKSNLPYELSISAGYSVMSYDDNKTFDMAITEADDKMYLEKTKKKVQRTE